MRQMAGSGNHFQSHVLELLTNPLGGAWIHNAVFAAPDEQSRNVGNSWQGRLQVPHPLAPCLNDLYRMLESSRQAKRSCVALKGS